ncbi:hypothetical protein ROSINTL182_07060 [Roseburia intestinalis L1-82]|uniref:Response regulatory domain-containing protein n=3 Tax=Roseburia intestinalis TaxID=166486 RepID=C7GAX9_9FIRM|nr:hypothetical protein ROSINTL182_07060 [Roseburia intestinalis L1-82]
MLRRLKKPNGLFILSASKMLNRMKEGVRSVYRIAVLAEQEAERQRYAEQITRFCEAKGLFPQVMQYDDQEHFFEIAQKADLTNAVIALSGVAGLNAAEHLRSLCPACRMIWCSDLDFSLHAFRLRADYFLMKPVSEEAFQRGLNAWIE